MINQRDSMEIINHHILKSNLSSKYVEASHNFVSDHQVYAVTADFIPRDMKQK